MQRVRKVLLILLGVAAGLLLLLAVGLKLFLTDERLRAAMEPALEEQLGREVSIGVFETRLLRSFPNVAVGAAELAIHTPDRAGEARPDLAQLDRLWIEVALFPLLQSKLHIKGLLLESPRILIEVYDDLSSNLIVSGGEEGTSDAPSVVREIAIERFQITGGQVVYSHADGTLLTVADLNSDLTARLGAVAAVAGRVAAGTTYLELGGIPYAEDLDIQLDLQAEANLDSSWVHFEQIDLRLADLLLAMQGDVIDWDSDRIGVDLEINAPEATIEGILSLLPAAVTGDLAGISGQGDVAIAATVRGELTEGENPALDARLTVNEGSIQYPGLPAAIQNITLQAQITDTGIELDRFAAMSAGTSLEASGSLDNYVTPVLAGVLKLDSDLSKINDFYPLDEGTSLTGRVELDAQVSGPLGGPAGFDPGSLSATGVAVLTNMGYASAELEQPIEQVTGTLTFSNKQIEIRPLTFRTGQSDVAFSGTVQNYLALAADTILAGQEPIIRGQATSRYFNASEQLSDDTTDTGPLVLPDVVMDLNFAVQELEYDGLVLSNAEGKASMRDGVITFDAGNAGFLNGMLRASGALDLSNPMQPAFDGSLGVDRVRASGFFSAFEQLNGIAKLGGFFDGFFDSEATINLTLDENFDPDLASLIARGSFSASGGTLHDMPLQEHLAELTGLSALQSLDIGRWTHQFSISGQKLHIQSLDFSAGDFTFGLNGSQGFDGSLDYMLLVGLPDDAAATLSQAPVQQALQPLTRVANIALVDPATGRITLDFVARGTFTDPQLMLNTDMMRSRLSARATTLAGEARAAAQAKLDSLENAARLRAEAELAAQRKLLEEKAAAEAGKLLGGIVDSAGVATGIDSLKEEAGEALKDRLRGLLDRKKKNN